jgi:hypothetical protein
MTHPTALPAAPERPASLHPLLTLTGRFSLALRGGDPRFDAAPALLAADPGFREFLDARDDETAAALRRLPRPPRVPRIPAKTTAAHRHLPPLRPAPLDVLAMDAHWLALDERDLDADGGAL